MKRSAYALAAALTAAALWGGGVEAAFPGSNGAIVFSDSSDENDVRLFVIEADGTGLEELTDGPNDFSPSFDASGELVVFERDGRIAVLDVSTGEVGVVTEDVGAREPSFSPDGERIVHRREADGGSDIFVVDVDGENPVRLTETSEIELRPRFSPSGATVAFSRQASQDAQADIFVMDADGSDPTNLTGTADASEIEPDWSPDGTKLVFARDGDIVSMPAAGGEATVISAESEIEGAPAFSPDGTKVTFEIEEAGEAALAIRNADSSGELQRITGEGVIADDPTWGRKADAVATPTPTPRVIGGDTQSAGQASVTTVVPSQQIAVTGDGFEPDQQLQMVFESDPVALGLTRSDEAGGYSVLVTIPATATAGAHQIVVSGPNTQGGTHRSITTVTVQASGVAAPTQARGDDLPASGGGGRALALAVWLLLLGTALIAAEVLAPRRYKPPRFDTETFEDAWQTRR
jgi:TolB protein